MRGSEDIEKIVRDGKPNIKTSNELDKLIIKGSRSIMDETNLRYPEFSMLMLLMRHKIAVSLIAAGIILIVGLLALQTETHNNVEPQEVVKATTQTPAEMMSLMSINLAYNRGGLDEVEKQYEKAMIELGPRPRQLTITELLAESNGT